ncbi:MAG TPA: dihydropteroate synthase [Alphaproteobacteria bacterium]|nr:dihydropteroate synthase [Alphaproteobacteria bacterium]
MRPDPILWPADRELTEEALRLAGGPAQIDRVELLVCEPDHGSHVRSFHVSVADLRGWAAGQGGHTLHAVSEALDRLTGRRIAFAGIANKRPLLMGVVNVTPDSFSDGGKHASAAAAIAHGKALIAEGADILDIGGESTRPGSDPVDEAEELRRVIPVIEGLAGQGAVLSIDTSKAAVMAAAVKAGATIINDVRALEAAPKALETAAASGAWIVLMHCQGEPKTMQAAPHYDHAALDVFDYIAARIEACEAAGIARAKIAIDPGIGFGKTLEHNLKLLRGLALYQSLGVPLLLGVSRKSFIGRMVAEDDPGKKDPNARLPGSLATALAGLDAGADMLRVHDVAETAQAVSVWRAMKGL